eukprot:Filipodium_phascolosomae@DN7341_c0_g1_i1.p1
MDTIMKNHAFSLLMLKNGFPKSISINTVSHFILNTQPDVALGQGRYGRHAAERLRPMEARSIRPTSIQTFSWLGRAFRVPTLLGLDLRWSDTAPVMSVHMHTSVKRGQLRNSGRMHVLFWFMLAIMTLLMGLVLPSFWVALSINSYLRHDVEPDLLPETHIRRYLPKHQWLIVPYEEHPLQRHIPGYQLLVRRGVTQKPEAVVQPQDTPYFDCKTTETARKQGVKQGIYGSVHPLSLLSRPSLMWVRSLDHNFRPPLYSGTEN